MIEKEISQATKIVSSPTVNSWLSAVFPEPKLFLKIREIHTKVI